MTSDRTGSPTPATRVPSSAEAVARSIHPIFSEPTSEVEILLRFHEEQRRTVRHHEEQRAALAGLAVTLSAALLAASSYLGHRPETVALGLVISGIGAYGFAVTQRHNERRRFHASAARDIRLRLDEMVPAAQLGPTYQRTKQDHALQYPPRYEARHRFWLYFHALLVVLGLAVGAMSLAPAFLPS